MDSIKKLRRLLEKPQRAQLLRFSLLSLISPAIDLFNVSVIIPVLQGAFGQGASAEVTRRLVFLSAVVLLTGVFEMVKSRASVSLTMDIFHSWSVKIYDLYGMEELEDHNRKTVSEAISAARNDPSVCAGVIPSCVGLAVDTLTLLIYAAAIVYIAQWIGVVCCALVALMMAGLYYYTRVVAVRYGNKRRQMEIRAGGLVSTMFGSYKEIKVDDRRKNLLEKYRRASADCAQVQKDYAMTQGLQGIVLRDAMQSVMFLFLAVALSSGLELSFILPNALIFITLLTRILPLCTRIVKTLTGFQYVGKYFEALQEALGRYAVLSKAQAEQDQARKKQLTLKQSIRVENLSFHYPNGNQIFEDVSFSIPAGCSAAIIGVSGAGKTTLLDLLLGLLRPQEGHIWYDDFDLVDGRDGQGPCQADIGALVSYIPQIIYLNDETIRSNVVFMAGTDHQDEARIIECLRCAQIWEDVRSMPDGLDTVIGRNGTAISGGQRQRIALPQDMATAALDVDTELAVIDAIRQTRGQKTVLMVTHRLSLANECKHIYKLEDRKLVKVR